MMKISEYKIYSSKKSNEWLINEYHKFMSGAYNNSPYTSLNRRMVNIIINHLKDRGIFYKMNF